MTINDDESIPLGKYPVCGWSSDSFTNWLTQNGVNNISSVALSGASLGIGIAGTIASGGALAPVLAGATVSMASQISSKIGEFRKASLLPNIQGNQPTGDILWSAGRSCFTIKQMRCKTEYLRIIDDYFTKFGYLTNRIKTPNLTGRTYWNFIEIGKSDDIGFGEIPSSALDIMNNACRRGVTIWHNHENIGNYSLDNSIEN